MACLDKYLTDNENYEEEKEDDEDKVNKDKEDKKTKDKESDHKEADHKESDHKDAKDNEAIRKKIALLKAMRVTVLGVAAQGSGGLRHLPGEPLSLHLRGPL